MNDILTQENGSAYVFSQKALQNRMAFLRSLLPEGTAIAYAVKANPFIAGFMEPLAEKFEICSPGEAVICDSVGIDPRKYVISGVYKTPNVIEKMVAKADGRVYTVESMRQFELLRDLSAGSAAPLPILLRLTNDSQFGINAEEIREIIENREKYPKLEILGIQYFSGTQKTSLKKLVREINMLDSLLQELEADFGYRAGELEYGTGFPVAYFGEDLQEIELITGFAAAVNAMISKPHLTIELGRSIAACCGSYYTRIVDSKCNKDQNYLLVDGGMHHVTYYGQFMGMKLPKITILGKENEPVHASYHVCGSMCSMNDILAKSLPLPEPEIGDILCFPNAGAYCMTEGMSLFLSRQLPLVFLEDASGTKTMVRGPFETALLNTPYNSPLR